MPNALSPLVDAAVTEHGEAAVAFAWTMLVGPLMPLAKALFDAQNLFEASAKYELTVDDTADGIALVGCLRKCDDPHRAWLAAEIFRRHCKDLETFKAALVGQPEGSG